MKAVGRKLWSKLKNVIETEPDHRNDAQMLHNAIGRISESEINLNMMRIY